MKRYTRKKVGGVKTPAKYKITGSDADIEPIHRSLMDYTFHVYQAAEKNYKETVVNMSCLNY